MQTVNELPRWRCHKVVRGFQIAQMVPLEGTTQVRLIDATGAFQVDVSNQYVIRYKPQVGDYYALYEDGYESLSPADAWEGGYAPIDAAVPFDISDAAIKKIFLDNGFKEKDQGDGRTDLNPYVYTAARELLKYAAQISKS